MVFLPRVMSLASTMTPEKHSAIRHTAGMIVAACRLQPNR